MQRRSYSKASQTSLGLAVGTFLLSIIVSSSFVLGDTQNDTTYFQRERQKERAIHNYHNIVVRNTNATESLFPYFSYRAVYAVGDDEEPACDNPSAIDDFPGTIFPEDLLLKGAVAFHFIAAIYFLSLLTIVCGYYFIPSVECICEDLHLSTDVAAATFMATATTMPEFFTNTISTFITDSDLGIGAIIGSMLFNTLGVSGCAALAASKPIQVDWWPVSRDSLLFAFHVSLLVAFAADGVIWWYETVVFVVLYFVYFIIMFQNKRIKAFFKYLIEDKLGCCRSSTVSVVVPIDPATVEYGGSNKAPKEIENNNTELPSEQGQVNIAYVYSKQDLAENGDGKGELPFHHLPIVAPHVIPVEDNVDEQMKLFTVSRESIGMTIWWYYTWPLRLVCACLIPNPIKYRRLYPLTFIMCMFVLALNSYMVVWMVTVIGYAFKIPEAVMGLTFLAAGGCLPEAASAVIMARKGDGALGISNSLGSNSLAVLFSLGLPWFLRTMANLIQGKEGVINIYNKGIEVTIMLLLFAVISLYFIISCNGYRLKRLLGAALICVYAIFVTIGILINMGIIFKSLGGNC